jgi:hypothetical protein
VFDVQDLPWTGSASDKVHFDPQPSTEALESTDGGGP